MERAELCVGAAHTPEGESTVAGRGLLGPSKLSLRSNDGLEVESGRASGPASKCCWQQEGRPLDGVCYFEHQLRASVILNYPSVGFAMVRRDPQLCQT